MTTIDRAAQAFLDKLADLSNYVGETDDLTCVVLDGMFDIRDAMRAAVEAMREPPDTTLESAALVFPERSPLRNAVEGRLFWRQMIDAILKENP